jgi:hypothetical protein
MNCTIYKPSVAENDGHCCGIVIYNENTNYDVWSAGSFTNRRPLTRGRPAITCGAPITAASDSVDMAGFSGDAEILCSTRKTRFAAGADVQNGT